MYPEAPHWTAELKTSQVCCSLVGMSFFFWAVFQPLIFCLSWSYHRSFLFLVCSSSYTWLDPILAPENLTWLSKPMPFVFPTYSHVLLEKHHACFMLDHQSLFVVLLDCELSEETIVMSDLVQYPVGSRCSTKHYFLIFRYCMLGFLLTFAELTYGTKCVEIFKIKTQTLVKVRHGDAWL